MADYTNNYKYVAEAWIENGEEEGFKTAFLASLFNQWQGHSDDERNPKFNADMVDGHHYEEISEEIQNAVSNTVKEFNLGYTHFGGSQTEYIIGTEAVRLYPDVSSLGVDSIPGFNSFDDYIDSLEFPWNSNEEYIINQLNIDDNPTIYEIIKELYYQLDNKKANDDEFQQFKTDQQQINNSLDNFHITEDGIDASSVNGLRFFVITQEQYENLEPEQRLNIHNVFIIKEQADITAYYESIGSNNTQYDGNPDIAPWNRAYEFKIDTAEYNGENQLCLMYKITGEPETSWKVIAPTSNFIDTEALRGLMQETVPDSTKEHFINSNYTLVPSNSNDYDEILNFPTTKVYDTRYISGAYFPSYSYDSSNNTINQSTYAQKTEVPIVTTQQGLQFLDFAKENNSNQNIITSLKNALDNKINSINETLSTLIGTKNDAITKDTIFGRIKKVESNITSHGSSISNLTNSVGVNADNIELLQGEINRLDGKIDTNEEFEIYPFSHFTNDVRPLGIFGYDDVGCIFLRRGQICYVYFYIVSKNNIFTYKTTGGVPNYIKISSEPIPERFWPIKSNQDNSSYVFIPARSWNQNTFGIIKISEGEIYYGNTVPGQSTNGFNILGSYTYPCQGVNE